MSHACTRSVTARRRRVVSRREFVKAGTAAAAMVAVGSRQAMALASAASPSTIVPSGGGTAPAPAMDASVRALLMDALNAATLAGAGYADARVGRTRNNFVFTREHQIIDIVDTDTMGCGVRVLVEPRPDVSSAGVVVTGQAEVHARSVGSSPRSMHLCCRGDGSRPVVCGWAGVDMGVIA